MKYSQLPINVVLFTSSIEGRDLDNIVILSGKFVSKVFYSIPGKSFV